MYQHHNLDEIGHMMEANRQNISPEQMLQRITHFVEHIQREDHFADEEHQRNLAQLEREFHDNNTGPLRNIYLSVRPAFMYSSSDAPYLWAQQHNSRMAEEQVSCTVAAKQLWQDARQEAAQFQQKFEADVQFIFSHVQHHWHTLDAKGQRVPLKYCRLKGRKGKPMC